MAGESGRLELAAAARVPCRIGRANGPWVPGVLCGCSDGSVVADVPNHGLRDGQEVRLWFEFDGEAAYFEATVARVGVAVPSRGAGGIKLSWLSEILAPEGAASDGSVVEILLPGGAAVPLLGNPGRLLDITPHRIDFELPRSYPVVFPRGGPLRLRLASLAESPCEVRGRVTRIVPGGMRLLYSVHIELVERADLHRRLVSRLAANLF